MTDYKAIERWENEGGRTLAVVIGSSNASNHVTFQSRSQEMFPSYGMHVQDPVRVDHGPEGKPIALHNQHPNMCDTRHGSTLELHRATA